MKKLFPLLLFLAATAQAADVPFAPDRKAGEGDGPFARLIIRGATLVDGTDWCIHERDRSAKNEIVAPRLFPYIFTGVRQWDGGAIDTPEQARKFAQYIAKKGADGVKIIGDPQIFEPAVLSALLDEANK